MECGCDGPYMHDGRFAILEEVVNHYSSGIQPHPNKDELLPTGGFNFTPSQKAALVAFLNMLTDPQFLADERFTEPFVPIVENE